MALTDKEIAVLLEHHAKAITTVTITNVEFLITQLRGPETPETDYDRGYRDALNVIQFKLSQLVEALAIRKPEVSE